MFSAPIVAGTDGAGGERLGRDLGFPGTFYAANITPAALNQWTDGEILRAIVSGVEPIRGREYAGGAVFKVPHGGRIQSANITPDSETGIGDWPREFFIARFRESISEATGWSPAVDRRFNTIMPWTMYVGMTDEDLGAIYTYLRTIRPVKNQVMRFRDLK